MSRPRKIRVITSVGTTVEVKFQEVDNEHVRILSYRRKPPEGTNFRRVRHEEGRVVSRRSFPHA